MSTVHSPMALARLHAHQGAAIRRDELTVADHPSPAQVLGRVVHAVLAWLFGLPPTERSREMALGALRHFWLREAKGGAFRDVEHEAEWGRRGIEALSWFCRAYDLAAQPLLIENWLRATLPNGARVAGRVDRVDTVRHAAVEVIDYKLGWLHDGRPVSDEIAAWVYALGARATLGRPVARVRYLYLAEHAERVWELQDGDLERAERRLMAAAACGDGESGAPLPSVSPARLPWRHEVEVPSGEVQW